MNRRSVLVTGPSVALAACAAGRQTPPPRGRDELVNEVTATETAFAQTMADRDHAAFARFIADDAVFLNGGKPLRGKAAIVAHWQRFYDGPDAPFSWQPELVEVNDIGSLAQSTGPVAAPPGGKVVARFYSTWRREPDGRWRIVFDNGYDACDGAGR